MKKTIYTCDRVDCGQKIEFDVSLSLAVPAPWSLIDITPPSGPGGKRIVKILCPDHYAEFAVWCGENWTP